MTDRVALAVAIESMQGQPDRLIAEATGEPIWKVRAHRQAAGIKGYPGPRHRMTRRDWLLADAAGILLENHP